jgi:hypothetical protein
MVIKTFFMVKHLEIGLSRDLIMRYMTLIIGALRVLYDITVYKIHRFCEQKIVLRGTEGMNQAGCACARG